MHPHPLRRLAWFTPLPPVRSGVAQYNIELLPGLATGHAIDLFVDGQPGSFVAPARTSIYNAHDFVWKQARQPYDLVVYQLGNATCHDYMWAYLARYPGLVVLHDGQLHHARGRALLARQRKDDYRSEFAFNHPDADPAVAELGIAGLLGSLTYLWPMRRIVIESARLVAVHNQWLADQICEEDPQARVEVVDMGVPEPVVPANAAAAIRARHGISPDTVVFAALGDVTPEKRISQAIHALAAIVTAPTPGAPKVHLLLAGQAVDHYDPMAEARSLGVANHVTVAGFVAHDDVSAYLAAADVCLCMRWPSSRETSAAWLRCLAIGRPTVTTDLVHMVDIPALDPRSWQVLHAPPPVPDGGEARPPVDAVCVSIDILDEDHSLRLAMRRLATDARLRSALAGRAKQLWLERFTLDRMVSNYRRLIDAALPAPMPAPARRAAWPAHFTSTGAEHTTRLLREMGWPESRISEIWRGQA